MPIETVYRRFFKAAIIIKTIDSIAEIVAGITLIFVSYDTLRGLAMQIAGDELTESPRDFLWTTIAHASKSIFAHSTYFWAILLLGHGVIKLALLIGLWREKLIMYPLAATAFALFAVYECYEIALAPNIFLAGAAILDTIIVFLIVHEYRHRKRLPLHRNER